MLPMYCGNNAADAGLLNGNKQLGTRYQCFRKGIGKGLNLPVDLNYNGAYNPIDPARVYCGNQNALPAGYDRMGNLSECLRKGVGVGKRQRAQQQNQGGGGGGGGGGGNFSPTTNVSKDEILKRKQNDIWSRTDQPIAVKVKEINLLFNLRLSNASQLRDGKLYNKIKNKQNEWLRMLIKFKV